MDIVMEIHYSKISGRVSDRAMRKNKPGYGSRRI